MQKIPAGEVPSRVPGMRALRMNFGNELSMVAVSPAEARMMAQSFREIVVSTFGLIKYDVRVLPIHVTVNREKNMIECGFGQSISVLVANPEVYLAWADRLTEAARDLVRHRHHWPM